MKTRSIIPLIPKVTSLLLILFSALINVAVAENAIQISVPLSGDRADAIAFSPKFSGDGSKLVFIGTPANFIEGGSTDFQALLYDVAAKTLTTASVGENNTIANDTSQHVNISQDGTFIVFQSDASNLVSDDENGLPDCFLLDTSDNSISLVSLTSTGEQTSDFFSCSRRPAVSNDGNLIAFTSRASNIVPNDTNDRGDIFVHSRLSNTTTRVSVASDGSEASNGADLPDMSGDGRYVVFVSGSSNLDDSVNSGSNQIYLHDRLTAETTVITQGVDSSVGDSNSSVPKISNDGNFVVFTSLASNLVADDTNEQVDVFLYDRNSETIERISEGPNGTEPDSSSARPEISSDGRFVVFDSSASNLIASETNSVRGVYLFDRTSGEVTKVSIANDGSPLTAGSIDGTISDDGTLLAYLSEAPNVVDPDATESGSALFLSEVNLCSDNPSKLQPGVCGCGVSDEDANGNANADCLDPAANSRPSKAEMSATRQQISVTMQSFPGATLEYVLTVNGKTKNGRKITRRSRGSSNQVTLKGKRSVKRWRARYFIRAGSDKTKKSRGSRTRVK